MIEDRSGTNEPKIDPRQQALRNFGGSSLSYSSLQEGLELFIDLAYGYISYSLLKTDIVRPLCLADPICSQENRQKLIEMFTQAHKGAVFIHITRETALTLSKFDFIINEIGVETIIDVQSFSLVGAGKEFLRSQRNRAAKDGLVIKEQLCSQVPTASIEQVSAQWMGTKVNGQELSFLARPAKFEDEPDVRKFFAYQNDRLVGFNFFDPIYRDGNVIGYLDNTQRAFSTYSYSIADCINLEAMRQFKLEGKEILSLGFSPLHAMNDNGEFRFSETLKKALEYFRDQANFLYDFKGSAFHKSRYRPGTEGCYEIKLYCACAPPVPILYLDRVFKKCGIDPIKRMFAPGMPWAAAIGANEAA
jgi:phosphatidylglycerol lysyltransferase